MPRRSPLPPSSPSPSPTTSCRHDVCVWVWRSESLIFSFRIHYFYYYFYTRDNAAAYSFSRRKYLQKHLHCNKYPRKSEQFAWHKSNARLNIRTLFNCLGTLHYYAHFFHHLLLLSISTPKCTKETIYGRTEHRTVNFIRRMSTCVVCTTCQAIMWRTIRVYYTCIACSCRMNRRYQFFFYCWTANELVHSWITFAESAVNCSFWRELISHSCALTQIHTHAHAHCLEHV